MKASTNEAAEGREMRTIRADDRTEDAPTEGTIRGPAHLSWCDSCDCYVVNRGADFALVRSVQGVWLQLCRSCEAEEKRT